MFDLFDYLSRQGDLSLTPDNFNDIDAVILSRLSYLPFEDIISSDMCECVTLSRAAELMFEGEERFFLWENDIRLIKVLAETKRFGSSRLSGFVNELDDERQMQFSAMIIEIGENTHFVSYRGTDNSIVGWQEDFNLIYTFPLPSQFEAKRYFENVAAALDGSFFLGGHSKGGNLAVYAASFCEPELQDRILDIYSFDGPGFELEHIADSGFYNVIDRIHTYVPQSSIVGIMFEHEEQYTVIQSVQKGFMQHDIYSWEVDGTELVKLSKTTDTSEFFDRTLTRFLDKMSIEERREFIEELFGLLKSSEEITFNELADNALRDTGRIFKSLTGLEPQKRIALARGLKRLVESAGKGFADMQKDKKNNQNKRFWIS